MITSEFEIRKNIKFVELSEEAKKEKDDFDRIYLEKRKKKKAKWNKKRIRN